jgi:hypothetical protein
MIKKGNKQIKKFTAKMRSNVPTFQQKRFSARFIYNNILKINNIYIKPFVGTCWNTLCFVGTPFFYLFFSWNSNYFVPTLNENYFYLIFNKLYFFVGTLERWNAKKPFQKNKKKSFQREKLDFNFE